MKYDCYKTPAEATYFDFAERWNDYRKDDGYSILGNSDFQEFLTSEVAEMLAPFAGSTVVLNNIADELAERHGEPYKVGTLHGCVQGEWQYIVYPERMESELAYIEQEYFNICDEWHCVPWDGNMDDGFYCFTYPLIAEDTDEQLKNICGCDEVSLHYPRTVLVWD